jgi:DEAD/DEAH box helicase domain-containing protein
VALAGGRAVQRRRRAPPRNSNRRCAGEGTRRRGAVGPGRLTQPVNISIEPDGTKYVTDPVRGQVVIFGKDDNYLRANVLENLMTVCADCHPKVETAESAPTALEGLAYVLGNLAPLFVMCDPGDLSVNADWHSAHMRLPTITIYELTSGGTGLCEELAKHHAALLQMATQRMNECACERGCPACVGPTEERHSRNLKADTKRLIEMLGMPDT